uniref:Reverse transcriptase domain-containing protein n=1 Tax=Ciona savignyi TaxID=51511 RepID=H2YWZ6_CIOSA
EERSTDDLWNEGKETIIKVAAKTIKKKTNKSSNWISDETLKEIKHRREIKPRRFDSPVDEALYKKQNAKVQKMMRKDKERYIEQQCEKIEENAAHNSTKELYQSVKKLTKSFKPSADTVKSENGAVLCDRDDIKERWKEYCSKLYKRNEKLPSFHVELSIKEPEPPPLIEEVIEAIKDLKNDKSPGADEVTAELIKNGGPKLQELVDRPIENVKHFTYLGVVFTDTYDDSVEIKRRIAIAKNATVALTKIWKDRNIRLTTKKRLLASLVFSIATYGAECWSLKQSDKKRIVSFELWCFRRLLRVSWTEKKTNEEILQRINCDRRLTDMINERKLEFIGHILRRDHHLDNVLLTGMVYGPRGRGRPKTRYWDDIRQLTGLGVKEAIRLAQNRIKWRRLVKRATASHPTQ